MKRWSAALVALVWLICAGGLALAQDEQAPAPAQPDQAQAPAVKKPAAKPRPPIKPVPKAGEVIPMDETYGQASPSPASTPAPAPTSAMVPAPAEPAAAAPAKAKVRAEKPMPAAAKPKAKTGQITLGALLPLTGALAPQGQSSKAALELAVQDINSYLAESGSGQSLAIEYMDTASNGTAALERIKELSTAGVRLVIGPYSDNEVDAVLDFAAKNGMLLLSQGSAGPYLIKKGPNLLRFSPTDAYQAESLAVLANQEGATQLICIWEGDTYGDELVTHVKGQFTNLGGQVMAGTRFRPEVTQMASYVADLKAQIDKQAKGMKNLAILVAARGDQTAAILSEASKISGLSEAKWYGCDDSALRGSIIKDPDVAKFADKVRIAFARYGETGTSVYADLEKRLEDKLGAFVDTQSMVAYDLAWLGMYSTQVAGEDFSGLRKAVVGTAEHFYGTTGWLALNENGDRRENYSFDFWTVKQMEGKFYWVKTARYQFDPGSMKQLIINSPDKE